MERPGWLQNPPGKAWLAGWLGQKELHEDGLSVWLAGCHEAGLVGWLQTLPSFLFPTLCLSLSLSAPLSGCQNGVGSPIRARFASLG